ncbi:hypothetical protein Tco_0722819, partial [Tanacetum coccineum]
EENHRLATLVNRVGREVDGKAKGERGGFGKRREVDFLNESIKLNECVSGGRSGLVCGLVLSLRNIGRMVGEMRE